MKPTLRTAAKRAAAPVLGVLDRRFRELAERLERHTANLAVDQQAQLQKVDDRLALDVRVIDENLLAMQRAARRVESAGTSVPEPLVALLAAVIGAEGTALVLVAGPGQALPPMPDGHDVLRRLAFSADPGGGWRAVPAGEDPATLRVIELRARP